MNQKAQLDQAGADHFIVLGIDQQLRGMSTIHLVGKAYTPDSLADLFRRRSQAFTDVEVARTALRNAIQDRDRLHREATQAAAALRTLVVAMFGVPSVAAAAFGFTRGRTPRVTNGNLHGARP